MLKAGDAESGTQAERRALQPDLRGLEGERA